MKAEDENALLLLAITYVLGRAVSGPVVPWGVGWSWPVPDVVLPTGKRYQASVSQDFHPGHFGVDIMFKRRSPSDQALEYPSGGINGSPWHFAPPGTPIVAARDGKVWSAGDSPRGKSVVIDHGRPFATYYQHLASLNVATGALVKAGQVIGTMGYDPLDASKLRHLHFAVWYNGAGDKSSVDPASAMGAWARPSAFHV